VTRDRRPVPRNPRYTKRITVRFGESTITCVGVVENISLWGMFITSNRTYAPGTKLLIDLPVGSTICRIEGLVRWARKAPAHLMRVAPSGMGVAIVGAPAEYEKMLLVLQEQRKGPRLTTQ
jgi:hypothetical protein